MSKFNISEIINENVTNLLNEGRLEDVKSKYYSQGHSAIDWLSENDPSGNNKYLDWMAKMTLYSKKYLIDKYGEDDRWNIDRYRTKWRNSSDRNILVNDVLPYFHEHPHKFDKKDINQYKSLTEFVEDYGDNKTKLSRKELKQQGGEKIYEDEDFILIHPKTHEASCKYGSSTRWCVTMRDHTGYFERYSVMGPLFFLLDKRRIAPTSSPKYMENAPDYYKVAIHYQPKFGYYGLRNLQDVAHHARKMTKEEFLKQADPNTTTIDYWNVQDRNVSKSLFMKYLGGPGRGQKKRADASYDKLVDSMEKYTKRLMGDFYDSMSDVVDNSEKIDKLESDRDKYENKHGYYENVYDQSEYVESNLEDVVDAIQSRDEYDLDDDDDLDLSGIVDRLSSLREKMGLVEEKRNYFLKKYDELNDEISKLEKETKKEFYFYDLSTKK